MTNSTEGMPAPGNEMRAVTISREYGSGGGEIAARLARRLGWQLIDHEVVVRVAHALGVSEAEADAHDEHVDHLISRMLMSLSVLQSPIPGARPDSLLIDSFATDSAAYDTARRAAVLSAVKAGQVVIVGRGAQVLLADRRDVLHVRIVAPPEDRIAYVMHREGLDHAAAQTRIQLKDRDRAHFLMSRHRHSPDEALLYDLIVNTDVLDLDAVVDLLALALERKAARLTAPAEALGPATGLPRYPEPPGNFSPPPAESSAAH
jgi:cytidylate kinase